MMITYLGLALLLAAFTQGSELSDCCGGFPKTFEGTLMVGGVRAKDNNVHTFKVRLKKTIISIYDNTIISDQKKPVPHVSPKISQ